MDERALARVRAIYDDVVRRMAEGFLKALDKDGWVVPDTLHQTRMRGADPQGTPPGSFCGEG